MANTKDRHSIAAQLGSVEQALRLAHADRAQRAYEAALEQPGAAEKLAAIEAEIAQYELQIQRLGLAAEVAARVSTERDVEAERAAQAARLTRLGELHGEINQASKDIVKALAALHKPLAQLQAAMRERSSVAWQAATTPFTTLNEAHRRIGPAFRRLTSGTPETSVLLAALGQSGLGRMGPSLDPWVRMELPRIDAPGDALQRVVDVQAGLLDLIAEAEVLANAPPKTYEETVDEPIDESTTEETSHE